MMHGCSLLVAGVALIACLQVTTAGRFDAYTTCKSCVAAGYGWNTATSKCGGFSNRVCAEAAPAVADSGQCGTEGPTEACAGDAGDELVVASDAGVSEQIKALYAKYNPDKLASLPAILEKYAGKEDTLLAAIQAKYTNAVKVIDSKNFASFVAGDDTLVMVEFYAPWCGHCKSLQPEYETAAQELADIKQPMKLGKVDATQNKELTDKYEVNGYPALKVFYGGEDSPWEYQGPRTSDGIIGFMEQAQKSLKRDPSWSPPKIDDIPPPPPPGELTPRPTDHSPDCKDEFDAKYGKGYCAKRHNKDLCMNEKHVGFSNSCKFTCGICAGHEMMPNLVTDYFLDERTNEDGNTQYQVRWRDVGPEWDSWEWEDQQNPSDKLWRNAKKKWEKLRGKKSPEALEAEMNAAI